MIFLIKSSNTFYNFEETCWYVQIVPLISSKLGWPKLIYLMKADYLPNENPLISLICSEEIFAKRLRLFKKMVNSGEKLVKKPFLVRKQLMNYLLLIGLSSSWTQLKWWVHECWSNLYSLYKLQSIRTCKNAYLHSGRQ